MGQFLEEIPEYLIEWILKQHMFWVASAPLSPNGHVNISPKAIEGTFHIVNSRRVWYEDLSGTGAETVSHIRENGRVTILFHAFEGPARIVRLYGKGFFYEIGTPEYDALLPSDKRIPGSRAVIGLDVHKVGTTCGYAVPYYKFISHRTQLVDWAARKESVDHEHAMVPAPSSRLSSSPSIHSAFPLASASTASWTQFINPKGMIHWWQSHNLKSLDGLPAFSMNLGRGFPFGIFIRPPIVQQSPPSFHLDLNRSSSTATTYLTALPTSQEPDVSCGLSDGAISNFRAYGNHDVIFSILSLLPFFLALVVGIFLGRVYESYSHCENGFMLVRAFHRKTSGAHV